MIKYTFTLPLTLLCVSLNSYGQPATTNSLSTASQESISSADKKKLANIATNSASVGLAKENKVALVAPSLEYSNPFDTQRKIWPDRIPPSPPAPPPPPPTPISEVDLQLYGVVIAGAIKTATVKVGPRFANLAAAGKIFTNLTEGQAVGEYRVSQITGSQVTLIAPGGRQDIFFTKKTDRAATNQSVASAAPLPPVQAATDLSNTDPSQKSAQQAGDTTPTNAASANQQGKGTSPVTQASPVASAPIPPPVNIQNSLAAAIAGARANAAGRPPDGNSMNPFMQKP